MAARLQTPSLQVVKDQRHFVFSLQRVDDDHGDVDVENNEKRTMDLL